MRVIEGNIIGHLAYEHMTLRTRMK